jgi:hypothetical protein
LMGSLEKMNLDFWNATICLPPQGAGSCHQVVQVAKF